MQHKQASITSILVLHFFFLFNSVRAQIPEPSFQTSPTIEFTSKKKELLKKIITSNESGYFALFAGGKYGGGKNSIQKFDTNLQPTGFRIGLKYRKKVFAPKTLDVFEIGNKLQHVWYAKTKEGIDFYAQEIDWVSGSIINEKRIARINPKESIFEYTQVSFLTNEETKKAYLYVHLINNPRAETDIRFFTFDSNMDYLKTENYTFPYSNEQFKIWFVEPFKTDKIILIGKSYLSKNISKSVRKKEYKYLVYKLENSQTRLLKEINPNTEHLQSVLAKIDGENLFVSGLIANQTISKPSSVYFLNYNLSSLETVYEKRNRIPGSFFANPEKREEKLGGVQLSAGYKKRNADSNYFSKKIITGKNEIFLIAEQSYAIETNTSMPNTQGPLTLGYGGKTYYSNDIAVFKLNISGELLWTSKIEKRVQWSGSDIYLSFYPVLKNKKLFMFYNGNYLNITGDNNFLRKNDSAFICTILKEDGAFQRNVISHYTEEYPNVAIPSCSKNISDKEVVIFSRAPGNIKRQKLTRVILK